MLDLSPEQLEATRRTVLYNLWARGDLKYLFHETQLKIHEALLTSKRRKFFLLCSRRLGKTFMLLALCFSEALKKPRSRIVFLAPTGKHASQIATDTALQLLQDCPDEFKPEYRSQAKEFWFKNGSIIRLQGVNGEHAADLRGGASDLVVLDECGQMDNLQHVSSDVVMPMTMTTNGRILFATTPPTTSGHDSAAIYEDLAKDGCAVKFTILDAPHVTNEIKREYLIEAGELEAEVDDILAKKTDPKTTTALREYFCEFVTDASKAVVPEFTLQAQREIVREYPRADYFDAYTALDPGFEDRTGILFAWYDFINARIIIEDEALLHRATTLDIAQVIKEKETALWGEWKEPRRVCDVDLRLAADLRTMHDLSFTTARKEDSLGAVNLLRTDVKQRRLVINPRCVHTIRQLKDAIWNNKATDFARAGERSIDGHYDLLAALKYLTRFIDRHRDPYPEGSYRPGGRFGPPTNSWISPKSASRAARTSELFGYSREKTPSQYPNTPVGRKLAARTPGAVDTRKRFCWVCEVLHWKNERCPQSRGR